MDIFKVTNKHSVPLSALKMKLEQYHIILPYYFAWFLNNQDSNDLINLAKNVLKEALTLVAQFKNDLLNKKSKFLISFVWIDFKSRF